jgi:hypothetical protein
LSRQQIRAKARKDQQVVESLADKWEKRRLPSKYTGSEVFDIVLPSGDEIKARRIPIPALLQMGQIPNRLLPTLMEWTQAFTDSIAAGADDVGVAKSINEIIARDPTPYIDILGIVWRNCVIEPITVPDEEYKRVPGTIPLSWVQLADFEYVFDWAQGVDESVVDFFRRRQAQGVAVAPAGEGGGEDGSTDRDDRPDEQSVADLSVE